MSSVILRSFNPETDTGIIYDIYPKGIWYAHERTITLNKTAWFRRFFDLMKYQLEGAADVYIACMESDPDTILGFSIVDDGQLEFVFVKPLMRNQGIGNLLTKNKYETINQNNITKIGAAILSKRKGESDERNTERTDQGDHSKARTSSEDS